MKNIANIINFARGCEPRSDDDSYLFPTLKNELELCDEFGFRSTVLLQYDALVRDEYVELCKEHADRVETGLWLEIVEPLCKEAGLRWNGRYEWDWKIDCNISVAYSREDRMKLADAAFEGFKKRFGYYPKVAGCWMIDAFTLDYINDKYALDAFCVCRDQYGTDGMTLWGGPYNGGYYPSKKNFVCPAQKKEDQIDLPTFRMLGPDPIYQYDLGLGDPEARQEVSTLEPVYPYGGGDPKWVDVYLEQNYSPLALSHSYAQFGQENSFGRDSITEPLRMQFEKLKAKADSGEIEVELLGETGRWFRREYGVTPPNSIVTLKDWKDQGRRSVWYHSKNYRVNFFRSGGAAYIRDLQLYRDGYAQEYLDTVCGADRCGAFALPVTDGFRFSKDGITAGLYPFIGDKKLESPGFAVTALGKDAIKVDCGGVTYTAREDSLEIGLPPGAVMRFIYAPLPYIPYRGHTKDTLSLRFSDFTGDGFDYEIKLIEGYFDGNGDIIPDDGKITIKLGG